MFVITAPHAVDARTCPATPQHRIAPIAAHVRERWSRPDRPMTLLENPRGVPDESTSPGPDQVQDIAQEVLGFLPHRGTVDRPRAAQTWRSKARPNARPI